MCKTNNLDIPVSLLHAWMKCVRHGVNSLCRRKLGVVMGFSVRMTTLQGGRLSVGMFHSLSHVITFSFVCVYINIACYSQIALFPHSPHKYYTFDT